MEADLEARIRELEIASSVHSINTKQLDKNSLQLVSDIRDIKEQMNLDLGRKGTVTTVSIIGITLSLAYLGWVSITIIDTKMFMSNLNDKLIHIESDLSKAKGHRYYIGNEIKERIDKN